MSKFNSQVRQELPEDCKGEESLQLSEAAEEEELQVGFSQNPQKMDESEFQQLLEMFPVVRSRDYHVDLDPSRQSTSRSAGSIGLNEPQVASKDVDKRCTSIQGNDNHDAFWAKLKSAAEKKVGAAEAERFVEAFQQLYRKLVYEELSLDSARRIVKSKGVVEN